MPPYQPRFSNGNLVVRIARNVARESVRDSNGRTNFLPHIQPRTYWRLFSLQSVWPPSRPKLVRSVVWQYWFTDRAAAKTSHRAVGGGANFRGLYRANPWNGTGPAAESSCPEWPAKLSFRPHKATRAAQVLKQFPQLQDKNLRRSACLEFARTTH